MSDQKDNNGASREPLDYHNLLTAILGSNIAPADLATSLLHKIAQQYALDASSVEGLMTSTATKLTSQPSNVSGTADMSKASETSQMPLDSINMLSALRDIQELERAKSTSGPLDSLALMQQLSNEAHEKAVEQHNGSVHLYMHSFPGESVSQRRSMEGLPPLLSARRSLPATSAPFAVSVGQDGADMPGMLSKHRMGTVSPRVPDGTRGFHAGTGRGRPLPAQSPLPPGLGDGGPAGLVTAKSFPMSAMDLATLSEISASLAPDLLPMPLPLPDPCEDPSGGVPLARMELQAVAHSLGTLANIRYLRLDNPFPTGSAWRDLLFLVNRYYEAKWTKTDCSPRRLWEEYLDWQNRVWIPPAAGGDTRLGSSGGASDGGPGADTRPRSGSRASPPEFGTEPFLDGNDFVHMYMAVDLIWKSCQLRDLQQLFCHLSLLQGDAEELVAMGGELKALAGWEPTPERLVIGVGSLLARGEWRAVVADLPGLLNRHSCEKSLQIVLIALVHWWQVMVRHIMAGQADGAVPPNRDLSPLLKPPLAASPQSALGAAGRDSPTTPPVPDQDFAPAPPGPAVTPATEAQAAAAAAAAATGQVDAELAEATLPVPVAVPAPTPVPGGAVGGEGIWLGVDTVSLLMEDSLSGLHMHVDEALTLDVEAAVEWLRNGAAPAAGSAAAPAASSALSGVPLTSRYHFGAWVGLRAAAEQWGPRVADVAALRERLGGALPADVDDASLASMYATAWEMGEESVLRSNLNKLQEALKDFSGDGSEPDFLGDLRADTVLLSRTLETAQPQLIFFFGQQFMELYGGDPKARPVCLAFLHSVRRVRLGKPRLSSSSTLTVPMGGTLSAGGSVGGAALPGPAARPLASSKSLDPATLRAAMGPGPVPGPAPGPAAGAGPGPKPAPPPPPLGPLTPQASASPLTRSASALLGTDTSGSSGGAANPLSGATSTGSAGGILSRSADPALNGSASVPPPPPPPASHSAPTTQAPATSTRTWQQDALSSSGPASGPMSGPGSGFGPGTASNAENPVYYSRSVATSMAAKMHQCAFWNGQPRSCHQGPGCIYCSSHIPGRPTDLFLFLQKQLPLKQLLSSYPELQAMPVIKQAISTDPSLTVSAAQLGMSGGGAGGSSAGGRSTNRKSVALTAAALVKQCVFWNGFETSCQRGENCIYAASHVMFQPTALNRFMDYEISQEQLIEHYPQLADVDLVELAQAKEAGMGGASLLPMGSGLASSGGSATLAGVGASTSTQQRFQLALGLAGNLRQCVFWNGVEGSCNPKGDKTCPYVDWHILGKETTLHKFASGRLSLPQLLELFPHIKGRADIQAAMAGAYPYALVSPSMGGGQGVPQGQGMGSGGGSGGVDQTAQMLNALDLLHQLGGLRF